MRGQSFPVLLRNLRERAGLSQTKLAQLASLTHSHISRLESGERNPTCDAVLRLAEALRLDLDERAALVMAAGYLPPHVLLDPDVLLLARLLSPEGPLAPADRDNLRQVVQRACTLALSGRPVPVLDAPQGNEATVATPLLDRRYA